MTSAPHYITSVPLSMAAFLFGGDARDNAVDAIQDAVKAYMASNGITNYCIWFQAFNQFIRVHN
jgi:hypothetical protein